MSTGSALKVTHTRERELTVADGQNPLLTYVYRPDDAQLESPRPYFHPMRTLAGDLITLYRPWDHVWHKGLSLSLPHVGEENFWGGVTWEPGTGYRQLDNNGSMDHVRFTYLDASGDTATVAHELRWNTQHGVPLIKERRHWTIHVWPDRTAWTLSFYTTLTSLHDQVLDLGSPTTKGRENAGYGGLFWRGPRSFTEGVVRVPGRTGGDDLMGVRAPWLAFTGRHDGTGRSSTLVFVDGGEADATGATQWFVRSTPYAVVCPAPFFSREVAVEPGGTLALRCAITVADGDGRNAARLAALGREVLGR